MKDYESIFILNPSIDEAESEKVTSKMQEIVANNGGEVVRVEKWGKKKLAYPVRKQKKGEYVLLQYKGGAATVAELERNFKMTDAVIKYLTVRLEKEALAHIAQMARQAEAAAAAKAEAAAAETAQAAPAPAPEEPGETEAEEPKE